eukprot:756649-Hanusia_phi.AAC.9
MVGSPAMGTSSGSDLKMQQNSSSEDVGPGSKKSWRDVLSAQPKVDSNNANLTESKNHRQREMNEKSKVITHENKSVTLLPSDCTVGTLSQTCKEQPPTQPHEPSNSMSSSANQPQHTETAATETREQLSYVQMSPGRFDAAHDHQQQATFAPGSTAMAQHESPEYDQRSGPYGPESLGPDQQELLERTSLLALNAAAAEFSPYGQPLHPHHPMPFMPQLNGNPHVLGELSVPAETHAVYR